MVVLSLPITDAGHLTAPAAPLASPMLETVERIRQLGAAASWSTPMGDEIQALAESLLDLLQTQADLTGQAPGDVVPLALVA